MVDYTTLTRATITDEVDRALQQGNERVGHILAAEPGLETTLEPLDEIADLIARTWGTTAFMGYVHPNPDVRAAGRHVEETLAKWSVDLAFRDDVYEAVTRFAETNEADRLTGERARLLAFTLRDLRKAGHELSERSQARLKAITSRLVELGVLFETNIAEDTSHLAVAADDLAGLPDDYIESLEPANDDGAFKVTMAYPHVVPFLEHATRRDLRQALFSKFHSRAASENRPLLEEAIALRREAAGLFGQPSWAHHKLDEQMAETPENVEQFYAELHQPLAKAAQQEIDRMAAMLESETGDSRLQLYDWRYYDTQLRKREYGVDPSEVAGYFSLENVLDGLLNITATVFGIRYDRIDLPVWHEDVISYRVHDEATGQPIGIVHMDLFPREGKFSHAAAFPLVPGRRVRDGGYQSPVSAIVANFTKPGTDRPSLLQHSEVETFFHEFGHILHQTLTTAELARFAGTATERDFVEAPSQIMEHWVWQPDVLAKFARHHITGASIPSQLVERLTDARRLNIAISKLRQIQYGSLDLELHGTGSDKDIDQILRETTGLALFPMVEGTFYPASFGHLMSGYDAGYYGYLWSEVYGDDMFSRFEEEGHLDPTVGDQYRREVLERGGTRDAIEHLRAFLGREPDNQAFLAKLGIG